MKAHLMDTHLLVPRLRSSAKVMVKYQGHVCQKMGVLGALVFHKHILFLKLTQFVHLIIGFSPIDIDKNWRISMGKVAILSWKFAFLVYRIKSAFVVRFSWNLQFVFLINSLKPIDFEKISQ